RAQGGSRGTGSEAGPSRTVYVATFSQAVLRAVGLAPSSTPVRSAPPVRGGAAGAGSGTNQLETPIEPALAPPAPPPAPAPPPSSVQPPPPPPPASDPPPPPFP